MAAAPVAEPLPAAEAPPKPAIELPSSDRPAIEKAAPAIDSKLARTGLAFLPGLFIPGFGHSLSGDVETAHRLRWVSGSALAVGLLGGGALLFAAGSHKLSPICVPLMYTGATVYIQSWLADILGTAAPNGFAKPLTREAQLSMSLQYGGSYDPVTPVRHLGLLRASYEKPVLMIDGSASLAPKTDYQEFHLRVGPKLWSDGGVSHLAFLVEGMRERGPISGATGIGSALLFELRLALSYLSPGLRGLVLTQRLGYGGLRYRYPETSTTDWQDVLIIDTGLAISPTDSMEIALLYTQRPDTRLGYFVDHGGGARIDARLAISERLRLLATAELGGGIDGLLGVEASW